MQLLKDAKNKRNELATILANVEGQLKYPPKGNLCVSKSHNTFQYYRSEEENPNKRYYLDKSKRNLAVALAQRDYNIKLLKELNYNLKELDYFINAYKPQSLSACYEKLPQARKNLIKPIFISDSEYALLWQKKEYAHKPQEPDGTFLTLKNVQTRQEFYWEHCGKMSDSEYTSCMARRLREFAAAGIIIGKNLLITMETESSPLSTKEVEQIIKTFLI